MNFNYEIMKEKLEIFGIELWKWLNTLSERTLSLTAIAILHIVFLPTLLAYMNGVTENLPSADIFIFVLAALAIMNLKSILQHDYISTLVHSIGFIVQLGIAGLILFK